MFGFRELLFLRFIDLTYQAQYNSPLRSPNLLRQSHVANRMIKVLLINQEEIPHYRVPIYNYLSTYLEKEGYALTLVSGGIGRGNKELVQFEHKVIRMSFLPLARAIINGNPTVIIYWVKLRYIYLFPMLILIKLLRKKAIYWGHGSDLYKNTALRLKKFGHKIEFMLSDALILYGEHLRKGVESRFYSKTFIANNTLYFGNYDVRPVDKQKCLARYKISTQKNIICIGRMQKRKKIENLIAAFSLINRKDVGLILAGPDEEGILEQFWSPNIFKIGPVYGDERLDLLSSADVFCLPGTIGLSIVDALYCGLPVITEVGEISPEIMYLKDGINGFAVAKDNVRLLADKIQLLLDDDKLREKFSNEARREIFTNGHIDRLCAGFCDALRFVC
jgi:glycosyltransferase involved in cell wall biosynthesis